MGEIRPILRRLNWITTVTVVVGSLAILAAFNKNLPPQVPLFYSRPWGESQLADPKALLVIPVTAMVCGTFVGLIAKRNSTDPLTEVILLTTAIIAQLVLLLGFLRIVWIVM